MINFVGKMATRRDAKRTMTHRELHHSTITIRQHRCVIEKGHDRDVTVELENVLLLALHVFHLQQGIF